MTRRSNRSLVFAILRICLLFILIGGQVPLPQAAAAGAGSTPIQTFNDPVAAWPSSFTAYGDRTGVLYDPANEPGISPDDVDFTSGNSKGIGDKPSFYAAGDGANLYFRMRMLGDPRDEKGGFLSSVWLITISQGGAAKAVVGLNGKSPHEDYIYVTNPNGSVIHYINKTDSSGSNVPGTRVTVDTNGDYLLDLQVPISRLTEIDPSLTMSSVMQYSFATSKAANLAVVNKDGMTGAGVYVKASPFGIYSPTIGFTNLSSSYDNSTGSATPQPTAITGTTTNAADGSSVALTITSSATGQSVQTAATTVNSGTWGAAVSLLANGSYSVKAVVTNEYGDTGTATQRLDIGDSKISINGGNSYSTFTFPTTISGGLVKSTSGNRTVNLTITPSDGSPAVYTENGIKVNGAVSSGTWTSGTITAPLANNTYIVKAVDSNSSSVVAMQTIKYLNGTLTISAPANNSRSSTVTTPTITGTADAGSQVSLFVDGQPYRTVTADNGGNWSTVIDRALGANANSTSYHVIMAQMTDGAAHTKQVSVNYGVDAVDVNIENSGDTVYVTSAQPTVRGSSTDTMVNVTFQEKLDTSNTFTISNVPVTGGKWSAKVPTANALKDITDYKVTVSAASNAAKTDTATLKVKTSTFVVIESPASDSAAASNASVKGTTEPNAVVNLNVDSLLVVDVTADDAGNWTYPNTWTDGTHNVKATTSDSAGNEANDMTTFKVGAKTVTFNSNGGSAVNSQAVDAGSTAVKPANPILPGYTFSNWYSDANLQNAYSFSTPVRSDLTLYAGWTASGNAITFDSNGGSTVVGETVSTGGKVMKPSDPVKNGYAFAGWYSDSQLQSAFDFDNTTVSGALTLYAGWTADASAGVSGYVYSATGASVPDITISVMDAQGQLLGTAVSDNSGQYTVKGLPSVSAAVYIANSKKTLVSAQVSLQSGSVVKQDLHFPDIASIELTADPQVIVGDGNSTSQLQAVVKYRADNTPVTGASVLFSTEAGTLSTATAVTDSQGSASSVLTAPAIQGLSKTVKSSLIVVHDLESGVFAEQTVDITYSPAIVKGIVSIGGKPVSGAKVKISEDLGPVIGLFTAEVTTGPDGSYSIIVPLANHSYTLNITTQTVIDGQPMDLTFQQVADVSSAGQGETVNAENRISGQLFIRNQLGKTMTGIFGGTNPVSGMLYAGNQALQPFTVDANGKFVISGLKSGSYRMLFQVTVAGQKLAGIWKNVTVTENGELAIEPTLIDPYGIVTEGIMPVPGMELQLYWADTELNRQKGRTPDTQVALPEMLEFAPSQNHNPQLTNTQGEYGWLVFADGDYYVKAVKSGYETYDSRVEGRNVPAAEGEDGYIQNGIIHVGQSIVKYDISVSRQGAPTGMLQLTVPAVTESTAQLVWNTVFGSAYYDVYQNSTRIATVTSSTYTVTGLSSGTDYPFVVVAANDAGRLTSNTVHAVTPESISELNDDIKNAIKNLKVGYSNKTDIWESVTLPVFLVKDGDYGTLVGWKSSNPDVISISEDTVSSADSGFEPTKRKFIATVKRQAADVDVILTATVSKGAGTSLDRTFLLIAKSTKVDVNKTTVPRGDNTVVIDNQPVVATITRTTLSDSKIIDKLVIGDSEVQASSASVLNVFFSDRPDNGASQKADQLAFEVPIQSIEKIIAKNGVSQALQVMTPEGGIKLASEQLQKISNKGYDLYFVIVPDRDQTAEQANQLKQEVAAKASLSNVTLLDIPREIKTNLSKNDNITTEVILPLTNLSLPQDPAQKQAYLNSLRVYVQHTDDNTTEIIGGDGNTPAYVVYDDNGNPTGLRFSVKHFSTFTLFRASAVPAVAWSEGGSYSGAPEPVTVSVADSKAVSGSSTIEVSLSGGKAGSVDTSALQVLVGGKAAKVAKVELSADGSKLLIQLVNPVVAGYQIVVKYAPSETSGSGASVVPAFELKFDNPETHESYLRGYPDGTFKPDNSITRAEMATILARLLGKGKSTLPAKSYPDVTNAHWAHSSIEVMWQTGIMKGYDDGQFKPEQSISRGEFAATVLRFLGRAASPAQAYSFPDIAGHWARDEIETMHSLGYMFGENGMFRPMRNLSRNEAVATLNRVLKRGPLTGDFQPSWPDVPHANWGYGDVEEASRTHEFTRINDTEERLIRFKEDE
ncbi:InlB B-repeat-containing protein [Paenibacillus aestuarii]|uniref:InlB B-repeat-containing protein n=1 Tax=Paenibacillus aestuarii TaxID=516965 RepID=A0ABW0KHP4_9BACL|nr:InlB B-repeat-containing protein [Paenibacillus aestuarii]